MFQRRIWYEIMLVLFLQIAANPVFLNAQSIKVYVKSVPERIGYLNGIMNVRDYYVSIKKLAEILNIQTYEDRKLAKIVLYLDGIQVTVSADNPFVRIGDKLYQMPIEAREHRSDIYVPIRELTPILDRYLTGDYVFDYENRTLEIFPGGEINITGMNVENKENGTLVILKTTRKFDNIHHWFDENKYHLTVQFYKGRLDTLQMTNTETRGLVLRSTAIQFPEIAQITFRLSRYTESYDVDRDPATGDILVSLIRKGSAVAEQQPIDPSRLVSETDELVAKERENWKLDTIIIDPGHGGKDPGTIIPGDVSEKEIVLDIAKHLKRLLEQSKLFEHVVLTREADIFVPLMERAEIAKDMNGKLFVSIHVNSNKNSRIRGFETYFLRPGKLDAALEELEVAQRENNVVQLYENVDPNRELSEEDWLVLQMTQSAFVKESELIAQFISEGIDRKVNWPNRGVKQAGFLVLWRVPMPNVLVGVGYITNRSQRQSLESRAISHRMAEGIFEGIKRFKEEVRR